MDERGRLPPATALAIGLPWASTERNEKSVSWLFKNMPPTMRVVPKILSTEAVMETTSPCLSTTTKCVVPCTSSVASTPAVTVCSVSLNGQGSPAIMVTFDALFGAINPARCVKYSAFNIPFNGISTKLGSAI